MLIKNIFRNRRRSPARGGPRRHEQGMVLILALLISVLMAILAIPYMTKLSGRFKTSERIADTLAARYLAEAGVERAIWELNYGNITTWSGSSSQRTLTMSNVQSSGGVVIGSISIVVNDPAGPAPTIDATGSVVHTGSATINKTIRVVVSAPPNIFNYAAFGSTKVNIHDNTYVDSYNSTAGAYGGANVVSAATLGSNTPDTGDKRIHVTQNAVVNGDAYCGYQTDPAQRIEVKDAAVVTGTRASLSGTKTYTAAAAPTGLTNYGNLKIDKGDTVNINYSGKYGTFEIAGKSIVNITGDVTLHLTTKLKIDDGCTLNVATGARLTVVLDDGGDGTLEMHANARVNTASLIPSDLSIVGTTKVNGKVTFKSQTDFYGSIYLPKADFKFEGTPQVFGSVIADRVELKGSTQFHYDQGLTGFLPNGVSSPSPNPLRVKSWQGTL